MVEPAEAPGRSLLLDAAAGDAAAARALLDETGATVYGFIFARVGGAQDVAEDLTQATYLEALKSARSFRGESALETWLCAIARRQVARHFASERRVARLRSRLRLVAADSDEIDAPADAALIAGDQMIAALGRLIPLHRQVLVLKYLDGLSVAEIARELGKNEVQVQSLLQRARAALKREIEEADA